ncbi:tetratricopeptide repeat-containing glycosyltransferase [Clostridium autoethanogenum]|uniref:Glycosyltransferase n=1 Tax=Clostridium autoethanogenum DSM 10061 TaxID=1341692 RepID=A0ABN4BM59_9CLOT|nr:glycosyltransferase [Clostridium autoethanogenum]AGY77269.1 glycosyltransferase [Clostridium autoethanogenum DSM 10061]ALU37411.1 Glycosyl transferase family 2 [Clostridium autoethanogenum DSM 10061]OVY50021.1 SPBc2 prophage-derived glycosyltransferase SunS [Clostridium autoethanogenum]
MLLSIGMMVKNEEKYLDKCLSAIVPVINNLDSELIIVDTGSTDKTVEIAKKYTDKVYFHKWNNNFSEIRNVVLSYCIGDWFFYVDGDEILEECESLINFFKSQEYKNYDSAAIYIKNISDLNDETNYSIFSALRLFKKDNDFKFVNAVHNQPLYKEPIKILSTKCKHYGYISSDKELMERKYKRTATILKDELKKNPENVYYLNQLSVSYGMHKEYNKAVRCIQKAYDCIVKKNEDIKKYMYVYTQLCLSYFSIQDYLRVEKYAKEALNYDDGLIDMYYCLGISSMILKKNKQAIFSLEKYLELYKKYYTSDKDISVIDYTLGRVNEVYYSLYLLNMRLKDYGSAKEYLLSISDDKHSIPQNIVKLCIIAKKYNLMKDYEKELFIKQKNEDIKELYIALEKEKLKMVFEKTNKFTEMFSQGNTSYNLLNTIRLSYENDKNIDLDLINAFLEKIDISREPFYFGDLIYYMIYGKDDISTKLGKLSFGKINEFLEFLTKKYDDFSECVYKYILEFGYKDDFYSVKINKELCRYLILLDKLEKHNLEYIYNCYIGIGIKYIESVYSNFVIENEYWTETRTEEESFFVYMRKAWQYKSIDDENYIKYLRMALDIYPYMKNLIDYLLNKEKENVLGINNDFEDDKVKVKSTIKALIENNKFDEADKIIQEYEEIVRNDMEIVFLKSEIALKKLKNPSTVYKM